MNKINLSINPNIINKGDPSAHGWRNVEMTSNELVQHILAGRAFSPGVIKPEATSSKKPTKNDIASAELLVLDIDNDIISPHGKRKREQNEKYLEFDTLKANPWAHEFVLLAYTTPSHTEEHHKIRIVFQLPSPIDNADDYTKLAKVFIARLGADPACSNIDRLFYGHNKAEVFLFGGKLTQKEINKYLEQPKKEQSSIKEYKSSGVNGSIKPEVVATMLSHIPAQMDYSDWIKIVSAVGNYFADDLDIAEKLIDDWSPDTVKGTRYRLQHRGKNFTIGSVIYYAKENGFDASVLYHKNELSQNEVDEDGRIVRKSKKKSDKVTVQEVQDYLSSKYDFRYNQIKSYVEFKKKAEKDYVPVTDWYENSLWCELQHVGLEMVIGDLAKILTSDFVPIYNPFKEYFSSLPAWDEEDHIQTFVDSVKVDDSQAEYWRTYFTRWIVATVACATETMRGDGQGRSVNHTCIVLVGGQGIGKTTTIRKLYPDVLKPYCLDTQIDPKDKDTKVLVTESFIINLDELESSTREEIASLKSLMTQEQVSLRKAYARRAEAYIRRASFIGSVNRAMFLTDITGSRRFLPVDVIDVDMNAKIDVDQLYAQALHYLHDVPGFKYWFDGDEIAKINENNKKYQVVSPEEELLNKYLKPYPEAEMLTAEEIKHKAAVGTLKLMTSTDIYDFLQKKTEVRMSHIKLGQYLKNLGFYQKMIFQNKRAHRYYICQEDNGEDTMNF